nr:hypothetical protein [Rhizobium sp. ACO-34A]
MSNEIDSRMELETKVNDAHRLVAAALTILYSSGQLSGRATTPVDQIETLLSKALGDLGEAVEHIH